MHPDNKFILKARRFHNRIRHGKLGDDTPIQEKPPFRPALSPVEKIFFAFRDMLISGKVEKFIKNYDLDEFDIIHLDQGQGFFRDARIVRRWHDSGKKLVAFYHGSDMRNRGIFRNVDCYFVLLRLKSVYCTAQPCGENITRWTAWSYFRWSFMDISSVRNRSARNYVISALR